MTIDKSLYLSKDILNDKGIDIRVYHDIFWFEGRRMLMTLSAEMNRNNAEIVSSILENKYIRIKTHDMYAEFLLLDHKIIEPFDLFQRDEFHGTSFWAKFTQGNIEWR